MLVALDLRVLRGPASGIVELPLSLHWSDDDGAARFDVGDQRQRPSLYATVLREAGQAGDLETWLNGQTSVITSPDVGPRHSCRTPNQGTDHTF